MRSRSSEGPAVVAVFNTSPDIVDMLRIAFEQAGLVVVATMTHMIRDGEVDIDAFLRQHRPDVIVYDIAPPYDANWRLFEHLSRHTPMHDCEIVLTSTNAARLSELVGRNRRIYEIVGKPYDLDQIVTAVREAAHARPVE
jgi:CheY-like chemotaxis protein